MEQGTGRVVDPGGRSRAKTAPQGIRTASARDLRHTCMANLLSRRERVYFKDLESRFLFVSAGWIAALCAGPYG